MIENQLKQLGFSQNEIKVYLSLFELGKVRAGRIIESTGLHRNIVYTALEEFVERELATKTIVGGVAEYVANDPARLVEEAEEKKISAAKVAEELRKKLKEAPREITMYEGVEGIQRARDKMLKYKGEEDLYVVGASTYSSTPEWEVYWKKFHTKREKLGIGLKILYDQDVPKEILDWRNSLAHSEARYLPFQVDSPVQFAMIGEFIDIIIPSGVEPVTFRIRSRATVEAFRKYFEFFWNQESYVIYGPEAVRDMWLEGVEAKEMLFISARGYFVDKYPKLFEEVVAAAKKKKNIHWKIVTDEGVRGHSVTTFPWVETKYVLPKAPSPNVVWMFGSTVAVVNWSGDQPIVFISKNPHLVQSYRDYFDALWKSDSKVRSGGK